MYKIKLLDDSRIDDAVILANKACFNDVFASYTDEGRANMMRYMLKKADILASQVDCGLRVVLGLYEGDTLAAMMVLHRVNHIALLYTDSEHRKKGYARALVAYASGYATAFRKPVLTVDASDFGLGFYQKCGFVPTGFRTENDGIIYTPMKLILQ